MFVAAGKYPMRRLLAPLLLTLTFALLPGCGGEPVKFDATNQGSVMYSIDKMSEGLTPDQKKKFQADVTLLGLGGYKPLDGLTREQIEAKTAERMAEINAKFKEE